MVTVRGPLDPTASKFSARARISTAVFAMNPEMALSAAAHPSLRILTRDRALA